MQTVASGKLNEALQHVAEGGALLIPTYTRATVIRQKHLDKWLSHGRPLLTEEGDGFRMRQGKGSVFLFPGQLKMID